ncbi:hypothetical protein DB346_06715 [Verrucomicrobia bacterium LW23]|nr:hypothetical protein DB346_06715 [Verrucomicrobia bacterium LW23]
MTKRTILLLLAAFIAMDVLAVATFVLFSRSDRDTPDYVQALRNPDTGSVKLLALVSSEAMQAQGEAKPWAVRGTASLTHKSALQACEEVSRLIHTGGDEAKCFNPRHALFLTSGGTRYEYVICFECEQMRVYRSESRLETVPIPNAPDTLDALLKAAGVEPTPGPRKGKS